jgi:predicted acylesterase/phospholipase RssA
MRFSFLLFFLVAAVVLGTPGCSVVSLYEHPNSEARADPDEPVGTYNASLNVPWNYDFTDVSEPEAAACRRYLTSAALSSGQLENSCEGVPHDKNFVALVASGGGGRSAALAAAVMWELDRIGVLKHVDVISAVSGGAQAAALYALMHDQADAAGSQTTTDRYILRPGDPTNFVGVFDRNLTIDWFTSLFMPWHLGPYLVTYLDRTDVMADTFADNYYPRGGPLDINWGKRFLDLNPKRPNLLLNATDMTLRRNADGVPSGIAGECFTFSYEGFRLRLNSDLHDFPISQAVMASSAYPGVFNYLSIRDFGRSLPDQKEAYIHLADGGIRDHLALVPINAMLRRFAAGRPLVGIETADIVRSCEFSRGTLAYSRAPPETNPTTIYAYPEYAPPSLPEKVLIIVIDAGRPPQGYPENDADPRANLFDRLVPVGKVIDAVDATLDDQRALRVVELINLRRHLTGKTVFEEEIRTCLNQKGRTTEDLAACLERIEVTSPDSHSGVFGPACCPVIGLDAHDFTKFADHQFGPLNIEDLDSDEVWGADHITLECLEDNDFGRGKPDSLYAKIRKMDIGLSLHPEELTTIRQAARALVDEMNADFCDLETNLLAGVPGISCTPPPVPREVRCEH